MTRVFTIVGLLLLTSLQYRLWFVPGGMVAAWHLRSAIAAQKTHNASLRLRNAQLAKEIQQWKQGGAVVEARARYELGMIKEHEVFYQRKPSNERGAAE